MEHHLPARLNGEQRVYWFLRENGYEPRLAWSMRDALYRFMEREDATVHWTDKLAAHLRGAPTHITVELYSVHLWNGLINARFRYVDMEHPVMTAIGPVSRRAVKRAGMDVNVTLPPGFRYTA